MRAVLLTISILCCGVLYGQNPPVLQWGKTYGGSLSDIPADTKVLPDGSITVLSNCSSNNGDILNNHGFTDIYLTKFDNNGNLLWQKNYGGSSADIASAFQQTSDGGFIVVGRTRSNDGDISGNHSNNDDLLILKLDAFGNLVWQKCYGGSSLEYGGDIKETTGGYIIAGYATSLDGDVIGLHGTEPDLWVIKIDVTGQITWQRCYGGSLADGGAVGDPPLINQTPDGDFVLATITSSVDGDVTNPIHLSGGNSTQDLWVVKITNTGTIVWDKCIGGNYSDIIYSMLVNNDGTIVLAGTTYSTDLPGAIPSVTAPGDGWILNLDASGNLLWQKILGGTDEDIINSISRSADGGYLLVGSSASDDGIVCKKRLFKNLWMIKLDPAGSLQWSRTYGGDKDDIGRRAAFTSLGECFVASGSRSLDGDLTVNKGFFDCWIAKFSFTGNLTYPSITIVSETDSIECAGRKVSFYASILEGGSAPIFQWKLNDTVVGANSDTLSIDNLQSSDVITCSLVSHSPCVDIKQAISNSLSIKVGPLQAPNNFLPKDTALCSYQKLELAPNSSQFLNYLWSDSSSTPSITVKKPGVYWLQVTDRFQCIGRDSITILPKACIEGVFVPGAFTPNNDGRNDVFMPILKAEVKSYRFVIYDRWGRIAFETTDSKKGWNGTANGLPYNSGLFIWQCQYQLEGEGIMSKKGTVLLIR